MTSPSTIFQLSYAQWTWRFCICAVYNHFIVVTLMLIGPSRLRFFEHLLEECIIQK
jgi:hypothetical protein